MGGLKGLKIQTVGWGSSLSDLKMRYGIQNLGRLPGTGSRPASGEGRGRRLGLTSPRAAFRGRPADGQRIAVGAAPGTARGH